MSVHVFGSLECVATLGGHTDRVWCCTWSPNGTLLATAGGDKAIRIYGCTNNRWACRFTLTGTHNRTVRSLAFSPCGKYLASASFDATVGIWHFQDGDWECSAVLEGHENEVKSVAWDTTGKLLATCSRDKSVWIWEANRADWNNLDFDCVAVLHDHTQDVKCVKWHPQREELVSCGYDDTIRFWNEVDDDDWHCSAALQAHQSTVWAVAFSKQDPNVFASCSDDLTVRIWRDLDSAQQHKYSNVCTLTGHHTRTIFSIDFSPSGYLASGGGDDAIVIYRPSRSTPELPSSYEFAFRLDRAHQSDINCVAWSADNMLATVSDDQTVKVWRFTPPEV